jgi:N-acetylmuramoyl-L-alanine amidase
VLLDLSQNATISASRDAATRVLAELDQVGSLKKSEVQHASLIVLTSPDVPSMLVETAFISNPEEERKLKDPGLPEELAGAIHAGVRRYFYDNPPPGTRVAVPRAPRARAGAATRRFSGRNARRRRRQVRGQHRRAAPEEPPADRDHRFRHDPRDSPSPVPEAV